MPKLTPEQQNAQMSAERKVLTCLLEAAVAGDFSKVKQTVIDYMALHTELTITDVLSQFKDAQKRTALHFACQSKETDGPNDIAEDILDWLPDTEISNVARLKDKEGLTPIMFAAQCADAATCERRVVRLLQADSSLALGRSKTGATALHYAAGCGAGAATIAALAAAANVAVTTFSQTGGTALHWACAVPPPADYSDTIAALIGAGAEVNARNETIPPALAMALAAGNEKHAKCLLQQEQQQGNVDLQSSIDFVLSPGGVTMYHMAADMNMPGTLSLLIERCRDGDVSQLLKENGQGYTALDLAAKEKHTGCVLLLLAATGKGASEDDAKAFIANWKPANGIKCVKEAVVETPPKLVEGSDEDPIETRAKETAAAVAATNVDHEARGRGIAHKATGNGHFSNKEWQEAIVAYTLAIEKNPADATFYSNRSACYMNTEEPKKALEDAVVCRCLRPEWPKAAYRMAVARLALGRFEDAAVSAWEGLQQDPENGELKSLLQKCVKKGRKVHHAGSKKGKD